MARRYFPKSTEELLHWYERYISPIALIGGFLVDNFILLTRVDILQTHLIFFFHLVVVALSIALLHFIETGRMRNRYIVRVSPFIPVVMQFSFGGLFSGYLALYSRSASVAVSWIFVVAIAALLIGNERFRRLYTRFTFQISLYFAVLFSFLIFFLPIVLHRIGPLVFVASGIMSLLTITILLWFLDRLVPEIVRKDFRRVIIAIAIIFGSFNILYFSNIIPPLPLALKEAGFYHSVIRTESGDYQLIAERVSWYEYYLLNYNTRYHATPGEGVYAYSAIFAPSGLSTVILHQWQRYDDASRAWRTADILRFAIVGGRDGGYRGYSFKSAPTPGKWRVNVITQYGQLIGRISFTVVPASTTAPLVSSVQ